LAETTAWLKELQRAGWMAGCWVQTKAENWDFHSAETMEIQMAAGMADCSGTRMFQWARY